MTRMQEFLARAAEELGLRVEIGYVVTLSDGRKLMSQALLPDLGNPLGTLVFDSPRIVDSSARKDIRSQGYGMSTFSQPLPTQTFDVESYARMFAEWGWAGSDADKPGWMD